MEEGHLPVMAEEVLEMLAPAAGQPPDRRHGRRRWAHRADPGGRQPGWSRPRARRRSGGDRPRRPFASTRFGDRLVLRRANFRELADVAPAAGFGAVDGLLFDLGLSSFQLADRERGFGFRAGGPLDMRFDTGRGVPASELLATLDADELAALFRRYGEEPSALEDRQGHRRRPRDRARPHRRGARRARRAGRRRRTRAMRRRIHPATRVFQALRIAVNEELDALEDGLAAAIGPAAARRPPGRPLLPLARGPHRQALPRGGAAWLRLPARGAGLRVRQDAAPPPRHPAVADPDRRRDRRQPPRPQRPPAGRRAARGLTSTRGGAHRYATRRPPRPVDTGHRPARPRKEEPREQAPPVQPPQELRPSPARAARAPPARPPARRCRSRASTTSPRRRWRTASRSSTRARPASASRSATERMAVYQGARQRTIVLPRRPRVVGAEAPDPAAPPHAGRRPCPAGPSRLAPRCSRPSSSRSRAPSSRCRRTSACRRPGTRSDRLATTQMRLEAQRPGPPQRAEPAGQGAGDPQAGHRCRPRPAARAQSRPRPLGARIPMLGRTNSRGRALLILRRLRAGRRSLVARLAYWQVVRRDELAAMAVRQSSMTYEIPASRGAIYDRTGTVVLATSVSRDRLAANPKLPDAATTRRGGREPRADAGPRRTRRRRTSPTRMTSAKEYVVLARGLEPGHLGPDPRARASANDPKLSGLILEPEQVRLYPQPGGGPDTTLAAHLLGFVNREGTGQYGIEQYYQDELAGHADAGRRPAGRQGNVGPGHLDDARDRATRARTSRSPSMPRSRWRWSRSCSRPGSPTGPSGSRRW